MIRLFAALPIPFDIGEPLQARQTGLPGARWRPLEALHITLRFFGDLREDVAEDLHSNLSVIAGEAFDLALERVGHFGEGLDIHAVWAGVSESRPLRTLARRCETAARQAGLTSETRAYNPHVTLAYLRRVEPARVMDWEADNNLLHSPPFRVRGFGLYSSHQTSEGSRYALEQYYPLG
jgi:2'-5' RNA ligase